ncbi:MAG: NACHT domain-containing protein [Balneola sp.]
METSISVAIIGSLSKILLKLWLKDKEIGELAGTELIDIIKTHSNDKLTQNRVERTFETIADKIVMEVLETTEDKLISFTLDEKNQIWEAVSKILSSPKLNVQVLIKYNLDPDKLYYSIKRSNLIHYKSLDEEQQNVIDIIISEYCNYAIDISSKLPKFREYVFNKLLDQGSKLVERVDEVSRQIKSINNSLQDLDEVNRRFELKYRREVIRKLDRIKLFGTDVQESNREYSLKVAYIDLKLSKSHYAKKQSEAKVSPRELLDIGNYIFIKGSAGSGKTTLLQWVSTQLAQNDTSKISSNWKNYVPFFIRLRQYNYKDLPTPKHFIETLSHVLIDTIPNTWIETVLNERAILLIDGLDELPKSKRDITLEWLNDIVSIYPNVKILISARPYIVDEVASNFIQKNNFHQVSILPMDENNIEQFIMHWHEAIKKNYVTEDYEEIDKSERKLHKSIKKNIKIKNIASSPLLCALLCSLNHEKESLPDDKKSLYESCIKLLVDRRERERNIEINDYPNLDYETKKKYLESIAYWMIRNKYIEVEKGKFVNKTGQILSNFINLESTDPEVVVEYFVNRTSILREPGYNVIDFTHKSFQEFLAAHAAIDEDDIGALVHNSFDEFWGETLPFACEIGPQVFRESVINKLLDKAKKMKAYEKRAYQIVALNCLKNAVTISSDLKKKINHIIVDELKLPINDREIEIYANLGDFILKPLSEISIVDERQRYHFLDTVAKVGSRLALEIFKKEIDNSPHLLPFILRYRANFNKTEFLKHLAPKTNFLSVTDPIILDFLNLDSKYEKLIIDTNLTYSEMSAVSPNGSIIELEFNGPYTLSTLLPITKFKNLKQVRFQTIDASTFTEVEFPLNNNRTITQKMIDWKSLKNSKIESIFIDKLYLKNFYYNRINPFLGLNNLTSLKEIQIKGSDIDSQFIKKNISEALNNKNLKVSTMF